MHLPCLKEYDRQNKWQWEIFNANKRIIKWPNKASLSLSFVTHASKFQQGISLRFYFIEIIHQKSQNIKSDPARLRNISSSYHVANGLTCKRCKRVNSALHKDHNKTIPVLTRHNQTNKIHLGDFPFKHKFINIRFENVTRTRQYWTVYKRKTVNFKLPFILPDQWKLENNTS